MPGPGEYGSGVIDRFSAMQLSTKLENDKKVLQKKLDVQDYKANEKQKRQFQNLASALEETQMRYRQHSLSDVKRYYNKSITSSKPNPHIMSMPKGSRWDDKKPCHSLGPGQYE